jgi:hypothetical protein
MGSQTAGHDGAREKTVQDAAIRYEIVVEGRLAERWTRQLAGMTVTALPGEQTLLAGPITDQPALHGVLARIRDLGLTLVSVARCEDRSTTVASIEQKEKE